MKPEERDYYVWHVVQALGKIGPAAKNAIPSLIGAKGKNPIVDQAVDAAVQLILKPTPPPANPAQPPAAPNQPAAQVPADNLITIVQTNADVTARILAARELGVLGQAKALTDDQKMKAIGALTLVNDPTKVDPDLACVAKAALDKLTK